MAHGYKKPNTVRVSFDYDEFSELLMFAFDNRAAAPEVEELYQKLMHSVTGINLNKYYTIWKTSDDPLEAEEARKKYVELKEIPKDFRW